MLLAVTRTVEVSGCGKRAAPLVLSAGLCPPPPRPAVSQ